VFVHCGCGSLSQVMIRDFADMLWSSYNFWCKIGFDKEGCNFERWANKDFHKRSPENFHELIVADALDQLAVVQPFYYPMHRPCGNAGGYYNEYIDIHLKPYVDSNRVIVVASEELETQPLRVAQSISKRINHSIDGLDISTVTKIRINSQDNKGASHSIQIDQYRPGVYNISDYRPMFAETRQLLDSCWFDDCKKIAARTGYAYVACFNNQSLGTHEEILLRANVSIAPSALANFTATRPSSDVSTTATTAIINELNEQSAASVTEVHARSRLVDIDHHVDLWTTATL
jgi:hypothetical protein